MNPDEPGAEWTPPPDANGNRPYSPNKFTTILHSEDGDNPPDAARANVHQAPGVPLVHGDHVEDHVREEPPELGRAGPVEFIPPMTSIRTL